MTEQAETTKQAPQKPLDIPIHTDVNADRLKALLRAVVEIKPVEGRADAFTFVFPKKEDMSVDRLLFHTMPRGTRYVTKPHSTTKEATLEGYRALQYKVLHDTLAQGRDVLRNFSAHEAGVATSVADVIKSPDLFYALVQGEPKPIQNGLVVTLRNHSGLVNMLNHRFGVGGWNDVPVSAQAGQEQAAETPAAVGLLGLGGARKDASDRSIYLKGDALATFIDEHTVYQFNQRGVGTAR